jgi:PTH1 family peptidyl-tRNA hydrolase
MKLFVGLGNPGAKYERNRHNIGFLALDRIAQAHGFSPWRKKFSGLASEGTIGGERVVLLKPETFMNDSGRAGGEAQRFLKIPLDDIYVFHDELDLAPGKLKVKAGGGNAGHNGLRSLTAHIGNEYKRVRLGIGHPGSKDAVVYYVLNDFAKVEREWLTALLDAIASAAPHLARGEDDRFLSDVALKYTKALGNEPGPREKTAKTGTAAERPKSELDRKPESGGAPHPAGERANKRASALADNLKKWLASRKSGD